MSLFSSSFIILLARDEQKKSIPKHLKVGLAPATILLIVIVTLMRSSWFLSRILRDVVLIASVSFAEARSALGRATRRNWRRRRHAQRLLRSFDGYVLHSIASSVRWNLRLPLHLM